MLIRNSLRYGATPAPNLPTLTPLNTTLVRAPYCPTARVFPGYAGALGQVQMNGVTHDILQLSTGMIDIPDLLAWWIAQPTGGNYANGPYPRLMKIYNQNPAFKGDMAQATEASAPVLDPNNIKSDGFWPASVNGFNGRKNDTAGVALAGFKFEQNTPMASDAGTGGGTTISSNTGNNSVAAVIGGIGNLGNAGTGTPQNSVFGMNHGTAANRWTFRAGDTDWTQRFGFGWLFGTVTKNFPATALKARLNRQVVLVSHSTAANIPAANDVTGTFPVSNIRVNGLDAESFSAVSTGRTSNAISTTGFFKLGSDAGGTAQSGDAFELYCLILYSNCLVATTTTPNDQRSVVENDLITMFNVRTAYTYQLACVTSSSGAYRGNVGLGVAHDVANRLRDVAISVEWYGHANPTSSLINDIEPNKAFISTMKRAGMAKNFVWVQVRSDLVNGSTGAAYYTASTSLIGQFNTDGWTNAFLSDYFSSDGTVGTPAQTQLQFDTQRAAYNVSVNLSANQISNNYTAISPDSLSQLSSFSNFTYFDDGQHPRCNGAGGGSPGGGTYIAAQIEAAIRAKL